MQFIIGATLLCTSYWIILYYHKSKSCFKHEVGYPQQLWGSHLLVSTAVVVTQPLTDTVRVVTSLWLLDNLSFLVAYSTTLLHHTHYPSPLSLSATKGSLWPPICSSFLVYWCLVSTSCLENSGGFRNLERGLWRVWKFWGCHAHFRSRKCIHDTCNYCCN